MAKFNSSASDHGDPTAADKSRADVGIVHALPMEVAPLVAQCQRPRKTLGHRFVILGCWLEGRRVAFVETGTGAKQVGRATRALIEGHRPNWIIATGFAGALDPQLRFGDVIVGTEVVGPDERQLNLDHPPRPLLELTSGSEAPSSTADRPADTNESPQSQRRVVSGRLLWSDHIVRTVEEKRTLYQSHEALAVDMETLLVAEVCRELGVRCLAVRVISDDAHSDLPPEVLTVLGSSRFYRLGAAAGAMWKRPGSLKDLWQLRDQAHRAADQLADFLRALIREL